ncbi:MAG TPA: tRNA uridine-5-carboxymethylaminomethyl(34) synthesis GTPase MnmE [Acidobacteriota bacterium]|nr:tRNA uridine-5-carboxymethylaminomethyl(34) synthesis GTPase MnmE [Acidobacteriota bacterium]
MKDQDDTICGLSTPFGRSGIAVVRVSGRDSHSLLSGIFRPRLKKIETASRTAVYGELIDPRDGERIDEALATCFFSPATYTGEDMVEISLHGNPVLVSLTLESLCFLGARLAGPGEFTLRAFLHGKIDLAQAEAVRDIIEAETIFQARTAARQKAGVLAQQLRPLKETLIDIIVNLESTVEFVEDDLAPVSRKEIAGKIEEGRFQLQGWLRSYHQGRVVKDGFTMAVIGRPNVGKSSVFNKLLSKSRSIVTELPGTTRDMISESLNIGGIPVHLQDTAGIHYSSDPVEKLGIDKSRQAINDADAILLVIDISEKQTEQDFKIKEELGLLPRIVILNKTDLDSRWSAEEINKFTEQWPYIRVSAKKGTGIEDLKSLILKKILGSDTIATDGVLITNIRHYRHLDEADGFLAKAMGALRDGLSEEFVLADLHKCIDSLGQITGETQVEDLLDQIFSRFCIGK